MEEERRLMARVDKLSTAVAPEEGHAVTGEQHAVPLGLCSRRLVRCRPDVPGAQILYVAPLTVVVPRRIVSPSGDRKISVAAEATTCIGDQRGIRHIAEDADDLNLPLMIWYGIEPLVPTDKARSIKLLTSCKN